jgi:putative SOS response-associated peptidase YedK
MEAQVIAARDVTLVCADTISWFAWLTTKDAEPPVLLQPFPANRMTMYPVSKRVGNVKNDDPELIAVSTARGSTWKVLPRRAG